MCMQLTFITNRNKSISYTRTLSVGLMACQQLFLHWTHTDGFWTAWFWPALWEWVIVAFSNCLTVGHRRSWWNILLKSLNFFLCPFLPGPYTAAFSASAWKGSQMSFRMASATPLETQVERNRCSVILFFLFLLLPFLCEGPETWHLY